MDSIFISYRRAGTSGYGGRLQEDLRDRFGAERVFRDIDSIRPGTDFVEVIQQAVARSGVVLALIGRGWLTVEGASGQRRIDDPDDFVRIELEAAFDQGITVIPVLVEGAKVPRPHELPESLARLSRIQGIELSDERWGYDVGRLVGYIEEVVGPASPTSTETAPSGPLPVLEPEATDPGLGLGKGGTSAVFNPAAEAAETADVRGAGTGEIPESVDVPDGGAPTTEMNESVPPAPEPPPEAPLVEPAPRRGFVRRHHRWVVGGVAFLVLLGTAVAFAVSGSKADRLRVPVVLEQDVATATVTLQRAGFVVTTKDEPDDTRRAGTVVAQEPAADSTAEKGAEVLLTISRTEKVAVPDVVNLNQPDADAVLVNAGLVPNLVEQTSDTVAAGTVLSQTPGAGTMVDRGSTVTLTVSTGRAAPRTRPPRTAPPGNTTGTTRTTVTNTTRPSVPPTDTTRHPPVPTWD